MSCEIKRVPLDFDWPIGTLWKGYVHNQPNVSTLCEACEGSGHSPAAARLHALWYGNRPFSPEDNGSEPIAPTHPRVLDRALHNVVSAPDFYGSGPEAIAAEAQRLCDHYNGQWCHHLNARDVSALLAADRLRDLTHTWNRDLGWQPRADLHEVTPEEVNAWSLSGLGHDSVNQWVCVRAECDRLGQPSVCEKCEGEGCLWPSAEIKAAHEAWEALDPPTGVGYQLWDTVTLGHPLSPVFEDSKNLAAWLSENRKGETKSPSDWMFFIQSGGWAPSIVVRHTRHGLQVLDGVSAMIKLAREEFRRY